MQSQVSLISGSQIAGYVLDPEDLDRRFVVELLLDGYAAGLGRAELFDPDLVRQGFNDGCYGFIFNIDPAVLRASRRAEIRLANSGEILGAPLVLERQSDGSAARKVGEVEWLGGLRFRGWVAGGTEPERRIRALIDGKTVAETVAAHWTNVGEGRETTARRGFDLHVPVKYADGCVHFAKFVDGGGRELPGSPCVFSAFPDGLRSFLEGRAEIASQRIRGELFDRLMPQSLPFSMFEAWRKTWPPAQPESRNAIKIGVALIGENGGEASAASLQLQQGRQWAAGQLPGGAGGVSFDPAHLKTFLDEEAKDCGIVVFAPSGAIFEPNALAALADAFSAFPASPLAYADFTLAEADGEQWPVALPAFDYERMLEQGCGALFFAARTSYVRAAVEAGATDLFRLFNFSQDGRRGRGPRHSDSLSSAAPIHVPGFLALLPRLDLAAASQRLARATEAHFAARGMPTKTEPGYGALLPAARVQRNLIRRKVSIIIPTRDHVDLLRPCVESLFATLGVGTHEIIVLDNDSAEPETFAYFDQIAARGVRVMRVGGPFNFSRIVNKGVSIASGEYVLLLNNDVEALQPGWLDEMLGRIAEPDVGAVGATLVWPSGVVQHGGVVLGPHFGACHAFNDRIDSDSGYADLLRVAHEVSAVTGACLLTERRLYQSLGGFDGAHFPVNFNDVDYCLKLRAQGLRVVHTTHARLLHRESASRGLDKRADQTQRFERELRNLRTAWGDVLLSDPSYHPLLSLDSTPYSALAWPPRSTRPRQPFCAQRRAIPPGF